jgi:hypothetical protein
LLLEARRRNIEVQSFKNATHKLILSRKTMGYSDLAEKDADG